MSKYTIQYFNLSFLSAFLFALSTPSFAQDAVPEWRKAPEKPVAPPPRVSRSRQAFDFKVDRQTPQDPFDDHPESDFDDNELTETANITEKRPVTLDDKPLALEIDDAIEREDESQIAVNEPDIESQSAPDDLNRDIVLESAISDELAKSTEEIKIVEMLQPDTQSVLIEELETQVAQDETLAESDEDSPDNGLLDSELTSKSGEDVQVAIADSQLTTPQLDELLSASEVVEQVIGDDVVRQVVRKVAPKYPRAAYRRNIEGWVIVEFTVDAAGNVHDPLVVDSVPQKIFNTHAVRAVQQWRYAPISGNGNSMSKPIQVKIRFAFES